MEWRSNPNLRDYESWVRLGKTASQASQLDVPPIYACVLAIADGLTALPLNLYVRDPQTGVGQRNTSHPAIRALMAGELGRNAYTFRHALAMSLAGWGNAYARIVRDGAGRVSTLQYFHPSAVSITPLGRAWMYSLSDDERTYREEPANVLHFVGPSLDGRVGLSPISLHQRLAKGDKLMSEYGDAFYDRAAWLSGYIKTDQEMSADQKREWGRAFRENFGREGQGLFPIFDGGMSFEQVSVVPPENAEFVEAMKFSAAKIAMIFRVPLHKLGLLDNATLSNVAELDRAFYKDTLAPYRLRIEQEMNRKLLSDSNLYFQHDAQQLLRGSPQEQAETDRVRIMSGVISPNEARAHMDLAPLPELDKPWRPTNVLPAGEEPPAAAPQAGPPGDEVLDADPTQERTFGPWRAFA